MITYHGCKCHNQYHKPDASKLGGYPVIDEFTMNATHIPEKGIVQLKCYYCEFEAEVSVPVHLENIRSAITIR